MRWPLTDIREQVWHRSKLGQMLRRARQLDPEPGWNIKGFEDLMRDLRDGAPDE